ncbi:MAG TPA: hypothetical protein VF472_20325 [Burkholderiaceae bacterium]
MSYARYKFNKAVQSLKEAGARRREWLASDHVYRLLRLTPGDVPSELQQEFQQFQREMRPILRASEIGIPQWSAIRTLDDDTVSRIIERVRRMHEVIEKQPEQQVVPAQPRVVTSA